MKKTYVFLADGFEEIEGLTVVDVLRRAGVRTETVSVMETKKIDGAHGIKVEADLLFEEAEAESADMIVLPGGMPGTLNLKAHEGLKEVILSYDKKKKYIGAICAAPSILGDLGLLKEERRVRIHPLRNSLTVQRCCRSHPLWMVILLRDAAWELRFRLH